MRKLPSRRYHSSYIGPDGLRHNAPNTYATKIDAEAWLIAERRLIDRAEWSPPKDRKAARRTVGLTVGEYAQNWVSHRPLKISTKLHYQRLLANHIEPMLGSMALKSLTPDAVRRWYAGLDPRTPTARTHSYGLLSAVCTTAVSDGLLDANPCSNSGASHTHAQRQPQILTVGEVAEVAEKIEPAGFRALVLICAWVGLRWGEVIELRRKDIGEGAEVISVTRAVTHRRGCYVSTPKSGKGRVLVVPEHIRAAIQAHLETHVGPAAEDLLFPPVRGGCHLPEQVFRHRFATACKSVGREGVRVHDLRHYAGSMTARVANVREVMDFLGHSTPGTSLKYQHSVSGRAVEIAAHLSRLAEVPVEG